MNRPYVLLGGKMLAGKKQVEKTVWAEYKDGFAVEIRFIPRSRQRDLVERAQSREWVDHQMKESTDRKKYSELVAKEVIANWRGLTADVLRKMVVLDQYPEEVPFTIEDCAWLLHEAYDFDVWIAHISSQIQYFDAARRAEEAKNSSPSPAGN